MKFSSWMETRRRVVVPIGQTIRLSMNDQSQQSQQVNALKSWGELSKKDMTPEERERHEMLVRKRMASKRGS